MVSDRLTVILLLLTCSLTACKKDHLADKEAPVSPTYGSRAEFTLDSIYLYAKQTYLWSDILPSYEVFNPRSYRGSDINDFKKELFAISQLKLNPATGYPYEEPLFAGTPKYSTITSKSPNSGVQGSVTLEGKGNDYGFDLTALNNEIWVSYVNPATPAYQAGLTRGCRVITLNGVPANAGMISAAMSASKLSLTVNTTANNLLTLNLTPSAYTANPVLSKKIINTGTTKTGYIAYNSFSVLSNSQLVLNTAFAEFAAAANLTNLVIDLRYNSGGYVETAEYFANLIVPSSLNGKVIYSEQYNELMSSGKAAILEKQPYLDANNNPVTYKGRMATMADVDYSETANTYKFSKKGNLETIKNIYFIVSGNTASASELLINSMKPYFRVKLAGTKTYGKPVGFFGINIDQYTMHLANFLIRNANGESGYFTGMPVDISAADDITHNFGDPEENSLKKVLDDINNVPSKPNNAASSFSSLKNSNNPVTITTSAVKKIPVMIEHRYKFKNNP